MQTPLLCLRITGWFQENNGHQSWEFRNRILGNLKSIMYLSLYLIRAIMAMSVWSNNALAWSIHPRAGFEPPQSTGLQSNPPGYRFVCTRAQSEGAPLSAYLPTKFTLHKKWSGYFRILLVILQVYTGRGLIFIVYTGSGQTGWSWFTPCKNYNQLNWWFLGDEKRERAFWHSSFRSIHPIKSTVLFASHLYDSWEREKAKVPTAYSRHRTWVFLSPCLLLNWWNGQGSHSLL